MSSRFRALAAKASDEPTSAHTSHTSRGPSSALPHDWRARLAFGWSLAQTYQAQVWLAWVVLVVSTLVFTFLVGQHALVRYQSFHADAFDLGNMDQAMWNTLHGHPFRFTNRGLDWQGPPTRLGLHVEIIFLLLAPLYLIHSGPETLLVLQTVALALGVLPLFLLARRLLPALPLLAAAFVVAYLWCPALLGEALWDFHPVALATPLLLTAVWALATRRYGWFVVAAVLAAMTKEDVALSLIPLGVALWIWHGRPRFGQAVIVLSLLWTALCFFVILPHFNGGASGGNNFWYRYAWLGSSAGDAVRNLLTHPWLPLQIVLTNPGRRTYLVRILGIGGGLSVFAPFLWLSALPELAVNLFSSRAEQYSGFYQYNAMLVAYFSAASVYGAAHLYNSRRRVEAGDAPAAKDAPPSTPSSAPAPSATLARTRSTLHTVWRRVSDLWSGAIARIPLPSRFITPVVILLLLVTTFWSVQSANPRLTSFWNVGGAPSKHAAVINALLARVPADAVVAATDTLDPHLSDRYTIYLMPDPQSYQADYVAADVAAAAVENRAGDAVMFARMLSSGRYQLVGTAGNVTVLKRTGSPLSPTSG